MTRCTSEEGIELIRCFEGFSARVYRCVAGYETIGYGHRLSTGESFSEPLDKPAATELLIRDLALAESAVNRLLPVILTDYQFDALVSFTFNLGAGALQRSTLRQRVLRSDHAGAAQEFNRWVYAGGARSIGLIRRREAEAACYLGIKVSLKRHT